MKYSSQGRNPLSQVCFAVVPILAAAHPGNKPVPRRVYPKGQEEDRLRSV